MQQMQHYDRRAGFTLIELLIVISILGILAAVLVPRLLGTRDTANETATKALMSRLETAIKKFERNGHGYFPTDDLRYVEKDRKTDWKADNGRNTGIESLVVMLSQSKKDGSDLGDLDLINTDDDVHGAGLPMLGDRRDRPEVADAWGTPMVYFSKFGMDRPQSVVPGFEMDVVQVKAKKRDDGNYYGQGKYQLLSAGKDMTFGTDDDLVWPAN